jgi:hypothetical protein
MKRLIYHAQRAISQSEQKQHNLQSLPLFFTLQMDHRSQWDM